ncbi:DUF3566 domain-containing protein [Amycolatopsis rhizosphaerae]|uniref:DUF3566 domain-containing protein n=1 Tax=Amycolatopsis rhizosphaerae TaxID=2053003 RepID=A0A558DHT3_9PSEU|nr:DUF3566 domain-containing protein [Amycolatopsis rhizosphaerae]TVT60579.1 DUF3566 domain-containing protein [Amycolatopsis rhizosphaerae]
MTSPETPETSTTNGEPATPPWQRVSKDTPDDSAKEATANADAPTQWLPGGQAGESVLYSDTDGAERPVVTGTAAKGMFGNPGGPSEETSGLKGQEPVSVAGTGTKRATPSALRRPGRGPRRASLQVKRVDPWSVLKLSLVLGVALFFVWLVAVGVLYTVLDGMGVWDKLNGTYSSLVSGDAGNAPAEPLISAGRVFGIAAILGAINIVLLSALATVSAFIYNVSADLAGGLEVTLAERE